MRLSNSKGLRFGLLLAVMLLAQILASAQDDFIKKANELLADRKHEEAIGFCNKALAANPKSAEAYNVWGNVLFDKTDYNGAIEKYSAAIKIDSNYKFAWCNRGYCYSKLQNADKALADYARALKIDPGFSAALNNTGLIYMAKGKSSYSTATKYFTEAIQKDSRNKYPYYNRGVINYEIGLYDDAITDLQQAISIDSFYHEAYSYRASCYLIKKDYRAAIADYTRMLQINPPNKFSYRNRGYVHQLLKEYEKALADFNAAIAIDSNYADVHNDRGTLFFEQRFNDPKNIDLALSDYTKAIAKDPNLKYPFYNRGLILYERKMYEPAIKDFDRVKQIDSTYYQLYYRRGLCWFDKGDYNKAMVDFGKAIKYDQANLEYANYNMGRTLTYLKEYDKSIEFYSQVLKMNPRNVDAMNDMGYSFLYKAAYNDALTQFNFALGVSPSNQWARNGKGLAYFNKGKYPDAVKEFEIAINIDSSIANGYANLIITLLANNEFDRAQKYFELYKSKRLTAFIEYDQWKFVRTYVQSCLYHISQRKYDQAAALLSNAVEEFEAYKTRNSYDYPLGKLLLANVYAKQGYVQEMLGRQNDAVTYFKKAVAINPAVPEAKLGYTSVSTKQEAVTQNMASATKEPGAGGLSAIPTLQPLNAKVNYHALLIAEQNYDGDEFATLKRPVQDVNALKELLIGKYNFPIENVAIRSNENRNEIISAMKKLLQGKNENDNLLIFFAGHGTYEKNSRGEPIEGYWVPLGAKKSETHNFISATEIRVELQKTLAKHVLVISDACFSGTLLRGSIMEDASPDIKALYEKSSRQLLASGNLEPVPDNSPFVHFLLKELESNKDQYVTATELWLRITKFVRNNSGPSPICEHFRDMDSELGQFIFTRVK